MKELLVTLLDSSLDSFALRKPPDEEIKKLMAKALGADPSDAEFEIHREVIAFEDYLAGKGEHGAKEAGKMRLEGKEYIVKDGDVMHFRFNV